MKSSVVETERIFLRETLLSDVNDEYVSWMNDYDVTKYMEARFRKHTKDSVTDYVGSIVKKENSVLLAIIAKDCNKHIGNIKLGPINEEHGFAILGVMIGDKNYWGKGYGPEAIRLAVEYAFNNLGLRKINADVYENNTGSIRAFQKSGFQEEGRKKKQYLSDGQWVDAVCFSINRDEMPEYQRKRVSSMDEASLKSIQIEKDKTIKEAMNTIDKNGMGTILITNNKKVAGLVTDGDIRRAVMTGVDVNSPIETIMNKEPVLIKNKDLNDPHAVDSVISSIMRKVTNDAERFIPVIDEEDQVIDLVLSKNLRSYLAPKPSSKIKRILLAGGAGYLGSILARKLIERNYKVRVLDTLTFGDESIRELLDHQNFELVKGDIRNIETIYKALKDIDSVVHLAAIVGDPACKQEPENTIEINYLATKVLAEACKYNQINRFIFASTASVYGIQEGLVHEEVTPNPVSLYARSKLKSEEGILSLVDENFSPTIFRMGTLYGLSPRMRFDLVVNVLTMKAVTEKKIKIFGGQQWRPLVHVTDAAEAYINCLEAPIEQVKGQIFNIGSNEQNYQIYQLGEMVKKEIPEITIEVTPENSDLRNYHQDNSKFNNLLGFKARYTVPDAIVEIRTAIEEGRISNTKDSKYYNS